jgi:hypothetical protein
VGETRRLGAVRPLVFHLADSCPRVATVQAESLRSKVQPRQRVSSLQRAGTAMYQGFGVVVVRDWVVVRCCRLLGWRGKVFAGLRSRELEGAAHQDATVAGRSCQCEVLSAPGV